MTETRRNLSVHLNNHQIEFIQRFLSTNSSRNHILAAPVGSGKTTVVFEIIYELVQMGAQRILIIVPALVLVDHYKKTLSSLEKDINVVSLDRKLIREIDFLNQEEGFWSKSIAIVSLRQAVSEEIKESILSRHWDLIIVDESEHFISTIENALFLQTVAEKQIAGRVLLLTNQDPSTTFPKNSDISQFLKFRDRFEITRWTREDIFPSKGTQKITVSMTSYKRSEEEVQFIKKYTSLSKWLSNKAVQGKVRSRLVSSSLYAAEESLRNLRNQLVHGELNRLFAVNENEKALISNEELLGDINSAQIDKKLSAEDFPKLMNDLLATLALLDKVQIDSKFNALSQIVKDIQSKEQRTWIYASYQSTISFLYSSLNEAAKNVYQIHGQMTSYDVSEAIRHFREDGGFLISSTNQLMGINFALDNLILYDTPENQNLTYTIFTRISGPYLGNIVEAINIFLLEDISSAIRSEQHRLRKMQKFLQDFTQQGM